MLFRFFSKYSQFCLQIIMMQAGVTVGQVIKAAVIETGAANTS
jgi:hypothetical protein